MVTITNLQKVQYSVITKVCYKFLQQQQNNIGLYEIIWQRTWIDKKNKEILFQKFCIDFLNINTKYVRNFTLIKNY